jgi:hypothetical protein
MIQHLLTLMIFLSIQVHTRKVYRVSCVMETHVLVSLADHPKSAIIALACGA